ncbi:HalOD1 output domain-containing protein [Natronococcus wangiae]|uniref:HalOD1 output domain-containing protein n=1 Tax=Natronococcus wangiae TaxID=3068275 RepID=UPI00273E5A19|nr:HalOD1 output domain-containing protein [Natronococcus sp. AD5]
MSTTNTALHGLVSEGDPKTVEHEFDDETPASIAVVQAICALKDVDPTRAQTELGLVLHEHIDPEALDTILADGTGDGETVILFEISNGDTYSVEVADDGRIKAQQVT